MRIQFDHLQPTAIGVDVTAEAVLERSTAGAWCSPCRRRIRAVWSPPARSSACSSTSSASWASAATDLTSRSHRRAAVMNRVTRQYSGRRCRSSSTITAPEREHRVYWWKEAIIVAVFYAVYSWTRNQFGSNKIAGDGIPDQAFTNAVRVIRCGDRAQPVPRGDHPGLVPAVQVVHPVLEHVLRHDALHRHARRVHPAVPQAP